MFYQKHLSIFTGQGLLQAEHIPSCLSHTLTYPRRKKLWNSARTLDMLEVRFIRTCSTAFKSTEKRSILIFFKQHDFLMEATDWMKSLYKQELDVRHKAKQKTEPDFTFHSGVSLYGQNSQGICNVIWQHGTKCFPQGGFSSWLIHGGSGKICNVTEQK